MLQLCPVKLLPCTADTITLGCRALIGFLGLPPPACRRHRRLPASCAFPPRHVTLLWNDPPLPADSSGHGTNVAGVVGAVGNNGLGVTGINWQVPGNCGSWVTLHAGCQHGGFGIGRPAPAGGLLQLPRLPQPPWPRCLVPPALPAAACSRASTPSPPPTPLCPLSHTAKQHPARLPPPLPVAGGPRHLQGLGPRHRSGAGQLRSRRLLRPLRQGAVAGAGWLAGWWLAGWLELLLGSWGLSYGGERRCGCGWYQQQGLQLAGPGWPLCPTERCPPNTQTQALACACPPTTPRAST